MQVRISFTGGIYQPDHRNGFFLEIPEPDYKDYQEDYLSEKWQEKLKTEYERARNDFLKKFD